MFLRVFSQHDITTTDDGVKRISSRHTYPGERLLLPRAHLQFRATIHTMFSLIRPIPPLLNTKTREELATHLSGKLFALGERSTWFLARCDYCSSSLEKMSRSSARPPYASMMRWDVTKVRRKGPDSLQLGTGRRQAGILLSSNLIPAWGAIRDSARDRICFARRVSMSGKIRPSTCFCRSVNPEKNARAFSSPSHGSCWASCRSASSTSLSFS